MNKSLLLFAMLLSANFYAAAQSPDFNPEIKRIAIFKNGYAFTYREGDANVQNGWAYTTRTPVGVLGTVWGYSNTPNVRVMQLLASENEQPDGETAVNPAQLLLANEGRQIKIFSPQDENKSFTGTYTLLKPDFENMSSQELINYRNTYGNNLMGGLTILLKTETGVRAFNGANISQFEIAGQPKLTLPKKVARLGIRTEGAPNGQPVNLGVAALERGVRWIPSYRVEVKGDPIKEAKLELEAVVINELADLKNSEMFFVVGVPSFLFQDTMSPLSINTAFAGVSSYFQTGNNRQNLNNFSNAVMTQARSSEIYDRDGGEDARPTSGLEEKVSSFSAEQLYLYQSSQINLKKGERTSLRLFSLTVPCNEVFEWTLEDPPQTAQNYLNYGNSNQNTGLQDLSSKIWYALKLKNKTGMPWTTAPALSFREWKPLGQNILTFTPVGEENILRVTPATEVIGTHKLEEKQRVREQIRYSGSNYDFDLVTIEGIIKIKNLKAQPVEFVLTRNVVGEVLTATDNGKIVREGLNLQSVNPNSVIKWNLTLPPGEKELKYSYKIYIRK